MSRVLITCRQMQNCFDEFRARFDDAGIEYVLPEVVQQPTEQELIDIIGGFDGMIAGDDPLTARVLEHAGRMQIISKWGIGVDGIDRGAADELGIKVTNTPGVFGDDVADVAMGYVVMLARQLHRLDASVRDGGWLKVEGTSLAGKTLGVIGFGSIGQALARRGLGFGMRVLAHDVSPQVVPIAEAAGVGLEDLDSLLPEAHFVVLCTPLTADNRHMIDAASIARMRRGSYLVNVARGPLVHEEALAEALASGHVAAAALDVFEEEPLPAESPLRAFPQCVFGTHNGSNTTEGVLRASALAVDNLLTNLRTG
jgi:D-3-phosphoglycerate dehydrogenase